MTIKVVLAYPVPLAWYSLYLMVTGLLAGDQSLSPTGEW